jgi:hypothetical protein
MATPMFFYIPSLENENAKTYIIENARKRRLKAMFEGNPPEEPGAVK